MTEPDQHARDEDLAVRVRAGLDGLAREAGDPPTFARATTSATAHAGLRGHPTRLLVGASVAVAALAIGLVLAVARPDARQQVTSGSPTTTVAARPLLDTRWWLVSATDRGAAVEVRTEGTPYLELRFLDSGTCDGVDIGCYDGPRVEGSDACNGVSRKMTVHDDTVALGDDYGAHTAMGCPDGLPLLLTEFFTADELAYSILADELTLTSTDGAVVLTYRAIDTPFGPTSSLVVDDGEVGPAAYRLVWDGGGLDFEVTDLAAGGGRGGGAGVGADPGRVNAMRAEVGGRAFLFGIVPATAARVVYEPTGGDPEEISIIGVDDPEYTAIGQLVDAAPSTWELVAYDAEGAEIHRLRWG